MKPTSKTAAALNITADRKLFSNMAAIIGFASIAPATSSETLVNEISAKLSNIYGTNAVKNGGALPSYLILFKI